jgi:hypothetical protein
MKTITEATCYEMGNQNYIYAMNIQNFTNISRRGVVKHEPHI